MDAGDPARLAGHPKKTFHGRWNLLTAQEYVPRRRAVVFEDEGLPFWQGPFLR